MTVPRTAQSQLQVHLFDNDLSSPTFHTNLTDRVQGLKFLTLLPGGYGQCRFTLSASPAEAWDWHTERPFYRLTVEDGTKTVFEGRLEDTELDLKRGTTKLMFYGYFANLTDVAWRTTKNQVWSDTIKDVLTDNCLQISSDQSNIVATDTIVNLSSDEHYINNYPIHLFNHLINFGDSSANTYDFAIWEDRIPFLTVRSVTSIDWLVNIADFRTFRIRRKLRSMWNSGYAVYGAADSATATVTDPDSIARFNLTRHHVTKSVGKASQQAAEDARDTWLAEHKDLYSEASNVTLGHTAMDTGGIPFPSSWVRAGDVIRVRDLVPPSSALDSITRDQERTFFILETLYDATMRTNRLTLDRPSRTLAALLGESVHVVDH